MHVAALPIDGAIAVTPNVFVDDRGSFKETYAATRYRAGGIPDTFVQDNLSMSHRHVLRGLHGDVRMAKLVQVLAGSVFDVVVDVRPGSATYRRWHGVVLSAAKHTQIYIPAGCLHGFLALDDQTVFSYKQSAEYDPLCETSVVWNDPDLAIEWPLGGHAPILSAKDASSPTLRELGL